jgi:uncharacterized membrane protein
MIRTPPGWGADMLTRAYTNVTSTSRETDWTQPAREAPIAVQRIGIADLRWALARGLEDFAASRTDVIFVCIIYPLVGLLMARLAFGYEMLPLLFPLASGFALVGPLAAVGLNEMSRRREQGLQAGWADALGVFRSPSIVGILLMGVTLIVMFLFWLVISQLVYSVTLGPLPPESLASFTHATLHSVAGWAMVLIGIGVGFLFAVVAMTVSVVSFPLLLDRDVSVATAMRTSFDVVRRNPGTMAVWGVIVAGSLVIGSIPLLLGLIVVMPVLGHATWHLYRRAVRT